MASYSELIHNNIGQVHQTNVANKILQFMDKIRNESDINQARRFLIELMQNARDLAYQTEDGKASVHIQICLTDTQLQFRHNAKVFSVKDILSIIHQVSSKKPGEGIGQFGTGFMSTYQLSEIIELESYLKDGDNPYKPFKIKLDRSGHKKEEILEAIEVTLQELLTVDSATGISEQEFIPSDYHTCFTYYLNNERSRQIARIGMDDLCNTILYLLLFSGRIEKVELIYDTCDKKETIVYQSGEGKQLGNDLMEMSFFQGDKERCLLFETSGQDRERIIVACEKIGNRLLPIGEKVPRLYIDFPLIGAEKFPFPIVMNCQLLHPNEPRSGISLVDNQNSLDARQNKEILNRAVTLYGHFLHNLVEHKFDGLEHVIAIPLYEANKEWSEDWVKKNLYGECFRIISCEKIFTTKNGIYSLSQPELRIIQTESLEEKKKIQELAAEMNQILVPLDEIDWEKAFSGYEISSDKCLSLAYLLQNAEWVIKHHLKTDKAGIVAWVGKLYQAAMENSVLADEIMAGKAAVFLTQDFETVQDFSLKKFGEIKLDSNIPECLKDVSEYLDTIFGEQVLKLKIRSVLLHRDFPIIKSHQPEAYELDRLVNYISRQAGCKNNEKKYGLDWKVFFNTRQKIWEILVSCGPNKNMKEITELFWKTDYSDMPSIIQDSRIPESMWKNAYWGIVNVITEQISNSVSFSSLCEKLAQEESEIISWLNLFYEVSVQYVMLNELKRKNIMLNQSGKFTSATFLYFDVMDEELKQIASVFQKDSLESNLEDILIDKRIHLEQWDMKNLGNRDAADRINRAIQRLLSTMNLSAAKMEHQEACNQLLGWIGEHEEKAQNLFPGFYKEEDRMKLLTTKAAAQMNRKVNEFQKLLKDNNVKSIEELNELIAQGRSVQKMNKSKMQDTFDYDLDFDVDFSQDEFLMNLSNEERSDKLREIGTAGERFVYQWLIEKLEKIGYQKVRHNNNYCLMVLGENQYAEIEKPDCLNYHQSGWDIRVQLFCETNGERKIDSTDYYEVKTCTKYSKYRKIFRISNEQMVAAASKGEHYHLVRVVCNSEDLTIVGSKEYQNPLKQLGGRSLANMENGYLWKECD